MSIRFQITLDGPREIGHVFVPGAILNVVEPDLTWCFPVSKSLPASTLLDSEAAHLHGCLARSSSPTSASISTQVSRTR